MMIAEEVHRDKITGMKEMGGLSLTINGIWARMNDILRFYEEDRFIISMTLIL